MDILPNGFPVSLKSWPSKPSDGGAALQTLIQRVNAERGGFVNISEESLRQEIAEADAQAQVTEDTDTIEEDSEQQPDKAKELQIAREEMLKQLDFAESSSRYALEFISLLLSKDAPVQASVTMSQFLRDSAGMGTLGADKLPVSRKTETQKKDQKQVAKGWKSQFLNKSMDKILVSATRLEKEIELETRYWEQVLDVSNNKWTICQVPNAGHILGVRFGFSEASPIFKNQSLAALERLPDGSISLKQGSTVSEPKTIRVRILTGSETTGSSPIPQVASADAPVGDFILEARNTIFAAELWHEMNREARSLGQLGILTKGDTVTFPLTANKTAVVDLISLNEHTTPSPREDDFIAKGTLLAIHLLLSYAHRQVHRKRTMSPPPISNIKRPNQPLNLLRNIVTVLNHQNTLKSLHAILRPLTAALSKASLDMQPNYTIESIPTPTAPGLPTPERIIAEITERPSAIVTFNITPATTITIRTSMTPFAATSIFNLSLSPTSPLLINFPPPHALATFQAVTKYIYFATASALASSFVPSPLPTPTPTSPSPPQNPSSSHPKDNTWHPTPHPTTLSLTHHKGTLAKELNFSIIPLPVVSSHHNLVFPPRPSQTPSPPPRRGAKLRLTWRFKSASLADITLSPPPSPDARDLAAKQVSGRVISGREGEGMYDWVGWGDEGSRNWDDGEGEVVKSLREVVDDAEKGGW